jgi:hypothetical protein
MPIRRDSNVKAQRSKGADDNVVRFRSRIPGASGGARSHPARSSVEGLAKYEGGEEHEGTYRHRMIVNLAALAFTIALACGWRSKSLTYARTRIAFSPVGAIARRSTATCTSVSECAIQRRRERPV